MEYLKQLYIDGWNVREGEDLQAYQMKILQLDQEYDGHFSGFGKFEDVYQETYQEEVFKEERNN